MSLLDLKSAGEPPAFDGLLAELSTALVQCPIDAIDTQLAKLVGRVARFIDVDHGVLARPSPDGGPLRMTQRWARPCWAPLEPFDPEACLPWITGRLVDGTPVHLAKPDDLPAEAATDRALLQRLGIRSIASLPLVIGEAPVGWLAFSTVREDRPWPPPVIDQLRRIAEIVGSALARMQADHAPRRAIEFDQLIAGLVASLIRVPVDTIDAQIVETLGTVGELLGADQASVVKHVPAQQIVTRTHRWVRLGTTAAPESDPQDAFPWLFARVLEAREIVALTRLDELPPEAARDRASLERNGVVSGALAPLVVEDRVVGLVLFGTVTREQRWSPDLVARLRLVGEIIASAGTPSSTSGRPCRRTSACANVWRPRTSTFRRSSSKPTTSARSSVGAQPSGRHWRRFARSPTPPRPSCSSGRPAPARSCSPARSTRTAGGAPGHSSR